MIEVIEDISKLELLIEKICQKVREQVYVANRIGNLEELLKKYGIQLEQNNTNF